MIEYEYAKALFDLAIEENKVELFLEQLENINDVMSQEQPFSEVMTSPLVHLKKKKEILDLVFKNFDETLQNYLYILVKHQRFSLLPNIEKEYRKMFKEYRKILSIQIISSVPLDAKQFRQVEKRLNQRYPNQTLNIKNTVDPKILGGMQIICNGERLDMSLKNQLLKLKESL